MVTEEQLSRILQAARSVACDAVWRVDPALADVEEKPDLYLIVRVGEGRTVSAKTRDWLQDAIHGIAPGIRVAVGDIHDLNPLAIPEDMDIWLSMRPLED
ncbi:hypothetical protein ACFQ36_03545 [Arthrobacter sp. GCM10027362]|uniref:hypothetical protein n=1 Tax=Arthrobacter sp. GCM10027362 TaxID=3273379 RepID=UPI00362A6D29